MATTVMTIRSSRFPTSIETLRGVVTMANANPNDEQFSLPVGFGDCILQNVFVEVGAIATILANAELFGVDVRIYDPNSAITQEGVGAKPWVKRTGVPAVTAFFELIYPAYWPATENLRILAEEVDTNAAPTSTLVVTAKVLRLRG